MLEITLSGKHTCQSCGKINVVRGVSWRRGSSMTPTDKLLTELDCDRDTCSDCLSVAEKEAALTSLPTPSPARSLPANAYLRDEDVLPDAPCVDDPAINRVEAFA